GAARVAERGTDLRQVGKGDRTLGIHRERKARLGQRLEMGARLLMKAEVARYQHQPRLPDRFVRFFLDEPLNKARNLGPPALFASDGEHLHTVDADNGS